MARNSKGKPSSKTVTIEHHHVDIMHHRMAIAGAAIVFVVVLLFLFSAAGNRTATASADQFMLIGHETCASCGDIEPLARDLAQRLNVPFTVVTYYRDVPYPGYVLVYNDIIYIAGVRSEAEFLASVCDFTDNQEICDMAQMQQSIESQTQ